MLAERPGSPTWLVACRRSRPLCPSSVCRRPRAACGESGAAVVLTRWSLPRADDIPEDLRDPFYIDQYKQEHVKPPVIKLLLSSELYCRVCGLILRGDQVAALQGHQAVIQALSRKGIYVMESDDTPVTEPDLSHAPIKMVSGLGGGAGAAGGLPLSPCSAAESPQKCRARDHLLSAGQWLIWKRGREQLPVGFFSWGANFLHVSCCRIVEPTLFGCFTCIF